MKDYGFSLVEILVSLAVIAIVTGLTLINFRTSHDSLALDRAASKLAQDIRRSAELAIQAKTAMCGTEDAYGIFADTGTPNSYILYANCNGDTNAGYNTGGADEDIETVVLDDSVIISAVSTPTRLSVEFYPPDPTVKLCDAESSCGETTASITLALKNKPTVTKIIHINETGFVDVN